MIRNGTISDLYENSSPLYESPCDSCLAESDKRVALIQSSFSKLRELLAESTRQQDDSDDTVQMFKGLCVEHFNATKTLQERYRLIIDNQAQLEQMVREKVNPIVNAVAFVSAVIILVCLSIFLTRCQQTMKKEIQAELQDTLHTVVVMNIFMVLIAIISITKQLLQAAGNGCMITFDQLGRILIQ